MLRTVTWKTSRFFSDKLYCQFNGVRQMTEKIDIEDLFAKNCFNDITMRKSLPSHVYQKIIEARLHPSEGIDTDTADSVASSLYRWALDRGVTHYCHWFQPLTGATAQKHDAFIVKTSDGSIMSKFTGKHLVKGEPDASSFPNGGLRETHMARGYCVWDPNRPPFILDSGEAAILYLPSVFFSWDGLTLDENIPYHRANERLKQETMRLLHTIDDHRHKHIISYSGPEQEFFLIDRKYYEDRPDLKVCGRTVFGCAPPKGQELDDQYLGDMSYKALNCLNEIEIEAWKLGIPVVTRHREVAPGQYELATHFDRSIVASDQNVLIMEVIKKISKRHGLKALFHEKPFSRVNGSGKHNNFSIGSDIVDSFYNPGDKPENNRTFMLFLAATIRAVHLHADLLRLSVSGYSNDFRLGAHEAPPAIISMFLGKDLNNSLSAYLLKNNNGYNHNNNSYDLGVHSLPIFRREPDDRNRTSPFAFTGNKFEFRSVGSSQQVMRSNLMLSTILADSMRHISNSIESKKTTLPIDDAIREVIKDTLKMHGNILFDGNNYSNEWRTEAQTRGLPRYDTTPEILPSYTSEKNIQLFKSLNIMSENELLSRKLISYDEYIKKVVVESKTCIYLARQYILPVAYKSLPTYQSISYFGEASTGTQNLYKETVNNIDIFTSSLEKVNQRITDFNGKIRSAPEEVASFILSDLLPNMDELRTNVDRLESLINVKDWPLPNYHHMLFDQ